MTGPGPGLSVGAMARRLGVAAATLRTWDQRYGIGPSRRTPGSHRRYDPADVVRLETMHRLILEGVPPGDAAQAALAGTPAEPRTGQGHGGGGNRLRLAEGTPRTRGLARAAMAMDVAAIGSAVQEAIRTDGVVRAWEDLVAPVLIAIGERHAVSGACVEIEHLFSSVVLAALSAVPRPLHPANQRPVLLACAPEEQHSLPMYALDAALAAAGAGTLPLGGRVPEEALAAAVRQAGPPVVLVWSQTAQTGDPGPLARLPGMRPAPRLLVGGPGWDLARLPEDVRIMTSLSQAHSEILTLLHLL